MFLTAFASRSSTSPQEGQTCIRTERLFCTRAPHPLQSWLVIGRVHQNHSLAGPYCLAGEDGAELTPASVRNGFAVAPVPYQVGDPQVFEIEGVVGPDQR